MADFYDTLNVTANGRTKSMIPVDEIKKAYRTLLKELHEDKIRNKNPGKSESDIKKLIEAAENQAKLANEAWDILSKPDKRSQYDRMGHDAFVDVTTGFSHWRTAPRGSSSRGGSYGGGSSGGRYSSRSSSRGYGSYDDYFSETYDRMRGSIHDEQAVKNLENHIRRQRAHGAIPDLDGFMDGVLNLKNKDLAGTRFNKSMVGLDLRGANLSNANLSVLADSSEKSFAYCLFDKNTNFEGANLSHRSFYSNKGMPTHFKGNDLRGTSFAKGLFSFMSDSLSDHSFENCHIDESLFGSFSDAHHLSFKNCTIENIKMGMNSYQNLVVEGGTMRNVRESMFTSIKDSVFKNVQFENVNFSQANLHNVTFEGSLKGLTLSNHQLPHVNLDKADKASLNLVDYLGNAVKNPFVKEVEAIKNTKIGLVIVGGVVTIGAIYALAKHKNPVEPAIETSPHPQDVKIEPRHREWAKQVLNKAARADHSHSF